MSEPLQHQALTHAQATRVLVERFDGEGLTVAEIATRLGISERRVDYILEQIESGVPLQPVATPPVDSPYAKAVLLDRVETVAKAPKVKSVKSRGSSREPAKCATASGYARHRKVLKDEPCQPCKDAAAEYQRNYNREKRGAKPRTFQPCGTNAAYQRHLKLGEIPCDPCTEARREQQREQYAKRQARKKAI